MFITRVRRHSVTQRHTRLFFAAGITEVSLLDFLCIKGWNIFRLQRRRIELMGKLRKILKFRAAVAVAPLTLVASARSLTT